MPDTIIDKLKNFVSACEAQFPRQQYLLTVADAKEILKAATPEPIPQDNEKLAATVARIKAEGLALKAQLGAATKVDPVWKATVAPPVPYQREVTMQLAWYDAKLGYKVTNIDGSADFTPGQMLSEEWVKDLLLNPHWHISSTDNDLLSQILKVVATFVTPGTLPLP